MVTPTVSQAEIALRDAGARLMAGLPFEQRYVAAQDHMRAVLDLARARESAGAKLTESDQAALRADAARARIDQGGGA